MRVTERSLAVDLNESIRFLLADKGGAVCTVSPEATVFDAIKIMSEERIGSLVVLSAGRLVGIVTERDYARKVILMGRQSEIMTAPVLCVTPDHSLGQCMHLMTSRRIRHVPVLDGDRVVGLVSIGDLVNWVITAQKETIRHLQNYITGSYPA